MFGFRFDAVSFSFKNELMDESQIFVIVVRFIFPFISDVNVWKMVFVVVEKRVKSQFRIAMYDLTNRRFIVAALRSVGGFKLLLLFWLVFRRKLLFIQLNVNCTVAQIRCGKSKIYWKIKSGTHTHTYTHVYNIHSNINSNSINTIETPKYAWLNC